MTGQELKGAEAMSDVDSKPRFGGNGSKGSAVAWPSDMEEDTYRQQNQMKEKGPTSGLEHDFCYEQI